MVPRPPTRPLPPSHTRTGTGRPRGSGAKLRHCLGPGETPDWATLGVAGPRADPRCPTPAARAAPLRPSSPAPPAPAPNRWCRRRSRLSSLSSTLPAGRFGNSPSSPVGPSPPGGYPPGPRRAGRRPRTTRGAYRRRPVRALQRSAGPRLSAATRCRWCPARPSAAVGPRTTSLSPTRAPRCAANRHTDAPRRDAHAPVTAVVQRVTPTSHSPGVWEPSGRS